MSTERGAPEGQGPSQDDTNRLSSSTGFFGNWPSLSNLACGSEADVTSWGPEHVYNPAVDDIAISRLEENYLSNSLLINQVSDLTKGMLNVEAGRPPPAEAERKESAEASRVPLAAQRHPSPEAERKGMAEGSRLLPLAHRHPLPEPGRQAMAEGSRIPPAAHPPPPDEARREAVAEGSRTLSTARYPPPAEDERWGVADGPRPFPVPSSVRTNDRRFREVKKILKIPVDKNPIRDWVIANLEYPYANQEERAALMKETGLSREQFKRNLYTYRNLERGLRNIDIPSFIKGSENWTREKIIQTIRIKARQQPGQQYESPLKSWTADKVADTIKSQAQGTTPNIAPSVGGGASGSSHPLSHSQTELSSENIQASGPSGTVREQLPAVQEEITNRVHDSVGKVRKELRVTEIVRGWMLHHTHVPYPTEKQLDLMVELTGEPKSKIITLCNRFRKSQEFRNAKKKGSEEVLEELVDINLSNEEQETATDPANLVNADLGTKLLDGGEAGRSHLLSHPRSEFRSENIQVSDQHLDQVNSQQKSPRPATGTQQQIPAVQPGVLNHEGKGAGKRMEVSEIVRRWMLGHTLYAYPSDMQLDQMVRQSGETKSKVMALCNKFRKSHEFRSLKKKEYEEVSKDSDDQDLDEQDLDNHEQETAVDPTNIVNPDLGPEKFDGVEASRSHVLSHPQIEEIPINQPAIGAGGMREELPQSSTSATQQLSAVQPEVLSPETTLVDATELVRLWTREYKDFPYPSDRHLELMAMHSGETQGKIMELCNKYQTSAEFISFVGNPITKKNEVHLNDLDDDDELETQVDPARRVNAEEARMILKNWMKEHVDYPYPRPDELLQLAEKMNLTLSTLQGRCKRFRMQQKHMFSESALVYIHSRHSKTRKLLQAEEKEMLARKKKQMKGEKERLIIQEITKSILPSPNVAAHNPRTREDVGLHQKRGRSNSQAQAQDEAPTKLPRTDREHNQFLPVAALETERNEGATVPTLLGAPTPWTIPGDETTFSETEKAEGNRKRNRQSGKSDSEELHKIQRTGEGEENFYPEDSFQDERYKAILEELNQTISGGTGQRIDVASPPGRQTGQGIAVASPPGRPTGQGIVVASPSRIPTPTVPIHNESENYDADTSMEKGDFLDLEAMLEDEDLDLSAQTEEERDVEVINERYKDLMKDIKNSMVGVNKVPPPDLQIYLDLIFNIYSSFADQRPMHCQPTCDLNTDPLPCCWKEKFHGMTNLQAEKDLQKDTCDAICTYYHDTDSKIYKLPQFAINIMTEWGQTHPSERTCPSLTSLYDLTAVTGLKQEQVRNYLQSRQSRNNIFENRVVFAQKTFQAKRFENASAQPKTAKEFVPPKPVTIEAAMQAISSKEAKKNKKKQLQQEMLESDAEDHTEWPEETDDTFEASMIDVEEGYTGSEEENYQDSPPNEREYPLQRVDDSMVNVIQEWQQDQQPLHLEGYDGAALHQDDCIPEIARLQPDPVQGYGGEGELFLQFTDFEGQINQLPRVGAYPNDLSFLPSDFQLEDLPQSVGNNEIPLFEPDPLFVPSDSQQENRPQAVANNEIPLFEPAPLFVPSDFQRENPPQSVGHNEIRLSPDPLFVPSDSQQENPPQSLGNNEISLFRDPLFVPSDFQRENPPQSVRKNEIQLFPDPVHASSPNGQEERTGTAEETHSDDPVLKEMMDIVGSWD